MDNHLPEKTLAFTLLSLVSLPASAADLSVYGMFMQADWVVKTVLIALLIASIAGWCIGAAKVLHLRAERQIQQTHLSAIKHHTSLFDALDDPKTRECASLKHAAHELSLSGDQQRDAASIKERLISKLSDTESVQAQQLSQSIWVLASIGAVAPFVGLFGTVWGIMNAFIGIAESQTANLAVVAPGIAEALLATAMGLVAAIPAVVFYNRLSGQVQRHMQDQRLISSAVLRLSSRLISGGSGRIGAKPAAPTLDQAAQSQQPITGLS